MKSMKIISENLENRMKVLKVKATARVLRILPIIIPFVI